MGKGRKGFCSKRGKRTERCAMASCVREKGGEKRNHFNSLRKRSKTE